MIGVTRLVVSLSIIPELPSVSTAETCCADLSPRSHQVKASIPCSLKHHAIIPPEISAVWSQLLRLQDSRERIVPSRRVHLTEEAPMVSIPKVVGVLSCGFLLCLGLSHAAQADNAAPTTDEMKADQSDRRQGGQEAGENK